MQEDFPAPRQDHSASSPHACNLGVIFNCAFKAQHSNSPTSLFFLPTKKKPFLAFYYGNSLSSWTSLIDNPKLLPATRSSGLKPHWHRIIREGAAVPPASTVHPTHSLTCPSIISPSPPLPLLRPVPEPRLLWCQPSVSTTQDQELDMERPASIWNPTQPNPATETPLVVTEVFLSYLKKKKPALFLKGRPKNTNTHHQYMLIFVSETRRFNQCQTSGWKLMSAKCFFRPNGIIQNHHISVIALRNEICASFIYCGCALLLLLFPPELDKAHFIYVFHSLNMSIWNGALAVSCCFARLFVFRCTLSNLTTKTYKVTLF